jgi:L-gulonate 5-dehydrogenase
MRAAIIHAPLDMRLGEWPTPRPARGEVLVRVAAAGVCAGDMYVYLGTNPYATYPQVCGHEIAGTVVELGDGASGPPPGSAVVVEPFIGCGGCYPCRTGRPNCCTSLQIIGVHRPGGFAPYLAVPTRLVHAIPAGLPLAVAAFAEPVAIAVHACRRGEVSAADTVLVLGCGPIGLALVEVARARGARVLATDLVASRAEVAARLGAEVLPVGETLLGSVIELTHGEGVHVVIEATGSATAIEATPHLVAAGGRIVIVGLIKQGVGVTFPGLDYTRKELTVVGSRASVGCFPEALALLAAGSIRLVQAASRFALQEAPQLFARLARSPGEVHKAVLLPEG